MRIFGIGIDVVEVARIATSIERHGVVFLEKIFTLSEREYCDSRKNSAIHYAVRFAAKEAVAKAFGTGIGGNAGLRDLEVIHRTSGAPMIRLSGAALEFAEGEGILEVHISLTHTDQYAAANAVAIAG